MTHLKPNKLWVYICGALMFCIALVQSGFTAHPQLFFSADQVASLRLRHSSATYGDFYKDAFNEIKIDCRSVYGPGKTISASNAAADYRQYFEAILSHGAMLLIDPTGLARDSRYQSDTRFFAYYNAALNASGWSNCFNDSQIQTSWLLTALAIGYDWHYDKFTSAQRQDIVNKLAARADYLLAHSPTMLEIPSGLTGSSGYLHYFKVLRNKFVMTFSALGTVAYALQGDVSESKRTAWLNKVDECLSVWSQYASPDGVSHEGYAYHEFQSDLLFPMLAARRYRTGVNEFERIAYLSQHPLYSMYSWIPGGDHSFGLCLPFGDTWTSPAAYMRQNAGLASMALAASSTTQSQLANWQQKREPVAGVPTNSYVREGPLHYFLSDHTIPKRSPVELNLPRFRYFKDAGVFVWRTGWDDNATYFAMTCGRQLGSHQQPEEGNFVLYKGGAPYVAHHGYTGKRRSENFNIMHIGGLRQWGAEDQELTLPQPESRWPSILQVTASNDYFNVQADLKPIYRPTTLQQYTREYVGFGDFYFVRDMAQSSASTLHENFLHAYSTSAPAPTDPVGAPGVYPCLDLDSNPLANPWSDSNGSWQIKPRSSGPFTAALLVKDLSRSSWAGTISADTFNYNGAEQKRGYKLKRSYTGSAASSLMSFAFAPTGKETVAKWPSGDGEGGVLMNGTTELGYVVWPTGTSINGTRGCSLDGAMGGQYHARKWSWGRNCRRLAKNGVDLFTSTAPASFFYNAANGQLSLRCATSSVVELDHRNQVTKVMRNGAQMSANKWSWANRKLTIQTPASTNPSGDEYVIHFIQNDVRSSRWIEYE